MARPILGWFGVVDERVDYAMVGEMARMRPDWSFAMVGPVVKVDPNLLPHSPNLYWLGGRDYQQLPNYCARVRRQHDVLRDQRGDGVHQPDQGPGVHGDRQADRQHARARTSSTSGATSSSSPRAPRSSSQAAQQLPRKAGRRRAAHRSAARARARSAAGKSTVETMQDLIKQAITRRSAARAERSSR